mmetsp:Transcript_95955/g.299700  ORF Transcript_95955/g.299700 Transcript_95955/m.299700 type:complete len:207 (+) Transcript_95955:114-734(+)
MECPPWVLAGTTPESRRLASCSSRIAVSTACADALNVSLMASTAVWSETSMASRVAFWAMASMLCNCPIMSSSCTSPPVDFLLPDKAAVWGWDCVSLPPVRALLKDSSQAWTRTLTSSISAPTLSSKLSRVLCRSPSMCFRNLVAVLDSVFFMRYIASTNSCESISPLPSSSHMSKSRRRSEASMSRTRSQCRNSTILRAPNFNSS